MVKFRFFWQIFDKIEQKEVNFLSALPDSMSLKPSIMANTAMKNSPVYNHFSSQLDHLLCQIAVLSTSDINNLHDSKL